MDLMAFRRMVMQRMSQGVEIIKGSITPSTTPNCVISIGKTLTKYMYLVELTDDSKTALLASGISSNRTYALIGMYPPANIGNYSQSLMYATYRVNPSSGAISVATANAAANTSGSQIEIGSGAPSSAGANYMMTGYTYKYTIIPLD